MLEQGGGVAHPATSHHMTIWLRVGFDSGKEERVKAKTRSKVKARSKARAKARAKEKTQKVKCKRK